MPIQKLCLLLFYIRWGRKAQSFQLCARQPSPQDKRQGSQVQEIQAGFFSSQIWLCQSLFKSSCDRRSLFSWPWRWKPSTKASTAVSWTRPFSPWWRASSLRRKLRIMLPDKRCFQQYTLMIAKGKAGTQMDIQNIPICKKNIQTNSRINHWECLAIDPVFLDDHYPWCN